MDFSYQGVRCREQTMLPDTQANRKRLEKVLIQISSEITSGTFSYRRHFPNSKLAEKFDPGPVLRPALFPTPQPKPFEVETAGLPRTARGVTRT
jgi:hypothetical protein